MVVRGSEVEFADGNELGVVSRSEVGVVSRIGWCRGWDLRWLLHALQHCVLHHLSLSDSSGNECGVSEALGCHEWCQLRMLQGAIRFNTPETTSIQHIIRSERDGNWHGSAAFGMLLARVVLLSEEDSGTTREGPCKTNVTAWSNTAINGVLALPICVAPMDSGRPGINCWDLADMRGEKVKSKVLVVRELPLSSLFLPLQRLCVDSKSHSGLTCVQIKHTRLREGGNSMERGRR